MESRFDILSFVKRLARYLSELTSGEAARSDDALIEAAADRLEDRSDATRAEFKEVLRALNADIDAYHANRADLEASGLRPAEWLEGKVERTVREIVPDADDALVDEARKAVENGLFEEDAMLADALGEEMKDVDVKKS